MATVEAECDLLAIRQTRILRAVRNDEEAQRGRAQIVGEVDQRRAPAQLMGVILDDDAAERLAVGVSEIIAKAVAVGGFAERYARIDLYHAALRKRVTAVCVRCKLMRDEMSGRRAGDDTGIGVDRYPFRSADAVGQRIAVIDIGKMARCVEREAIAGRGGVIADDTSGRDLVHIGHIDGDRLDDAVAGAVRGADFEVVTVQGLTVELRTFFQRDRVAVDFEQRMAAHDFVAVPVLAVRIGGAQPSDDDVPLGIFGNERKLCLERSRRFVRWPRQWSAGFRCGVLAAGLGLFLGIRLRNGSPRRRLGRFIAE